jgi:hypothetical protein
MGLWWSRGSVLAFGTQVRWSRGSVLAFGTLVCGFKPGRSRRIFRVKKSSARLPSEIFQGRWQNGEKVGYCYPSRLEKTLCKWDIYVPLVTKGLIALNVFCVSYVSFE